jgi:hypothetical protein
LIACQNQVPPGVSKVLKPFAGQGAAAAKKKAEEAEEAEKSEKAKKQNEKGDGSPLDLTISRDQAGDLMKTIIGGGGTVLIFIWDALTGQWIPKSI